MFNVVQQQAADFLLQAQQLNKPIEDATRLQEVVDHVHHVIARCDDLQRRVKHVGGRDFFFDVDTMSIKLSQVLEVIQNREAIVRNLANRVTV